MARFYIASTAVLTNGLCFLRLLVPRRASAGLTREMWPGAIGLQWKNGHDSIYFGQCDPFRMADP